MPTFSEIIVLASFRTQHSKAWYQDDSVGNLPPRTHTHCRLLSVPLLSMKEVLLLNCSSWHSAPFMDQTNRHLGCNKLVHSQNNNKYGHENTIVFTWKWSNYILAGWLFQFSTTGKNKSYKKNGQLQERWDTGFCCVFRSKRAASHTAWRIYCKIKFWISNNQFLWIRTAVGFCYLIYSWQRFFCL